MKDKRGMKVTGRRGRRRRKLLDDLKESRGYSHLKEEALDRTMWRARFGRGFEPVVSQTTKCMKTPQDGGNVMQKMRFYWTHSGAMRTWNSTNKYDGIQLYY
jgi:hypothetical protein